MKIKKKTIKRDEWPVEYNKSVLIGKERINNKDALIALIYWEQGVKKVRVSNKTLLIVDEDYSWLEIAIENQYYWITAMYDDKDEFIEAYFDLNSKNVLDGGNSYFYDMFSDIIISRDKSIHILDENELDMAYKEGLITKREYNRTKKVTKNLYNYIVNNVDDIIEYLNKKHLEYKKQIKENML